MSTQPKPNLTAAIPYVVLLGFLFGSGIVVSRFSIGQFVPVTFAGVRLLLAAKAMIFMGFSRVD